MRILSRTTIADGIEFRSRLEAAWYLYLQQIGFSPIYEPQTFDLPFGPYLPDFYLPESNCYVEVKPDIQQFELRDMQSICSAYVLGYTTPTIVVIGTPFDYVAFQCERCEEGNPYGFFVFFSNSSDRVGWGLMCIRECYMSSCYPDEIRCDIRMQRHEWDFRDYLDEGTKSEFKWACNVWRPEACKAWNATKWRHVAK